MNRFALIISIVFIQTSGSGTYADYGPQHFMDKNVVVVTMNYRLGPFGFLSMGSENVPGNAGFRDQVLALERIQELIGIF